MSINYNQFGQLHDSVVISNPYTGEDQTIGDFFDSIRDDFVLESAFNDTFCRRLDNENIIEDMINFFDYCDFSTSDMEGKTAEEAFDILCEFARDEANEARRLLNKCEAEAIEAFSAKVEKLEENPDNWDVLINNFRTKGTASVAYIEALEAGDLDQAEELLEKIEGANWRHNETDYDELRQSVGKEAATRIIYNY